MNKQKAVTTRQLETKNLMDEELKKLLQKAYNPITANTTDNKAIYVIETSTAFIKALEEIEKELKGAASTKRDLKSVLRFIDSAAGVLGIRELPIQSISRKHIRYLLAQIERTHGASHHRYNKIRSYLMMLFNGLIEIEAIENNPVIAIAKQKTIQKLRKVLSLEDRRKINQYLMENHYRLWLFTHIFFHSGARLTEMMGVRRSDIDLAQQFFVVTIKKGKAVKEVRKTIKNIALPFWEEAVKDAAPCHYIFSKDLEPGEVRIDSSQITRRWNRHIKKKLEITEDFYSLKHLNLDETAARLNMHDAAAMASHNSTTTTSKHYTINENQRQQERLRNITNHFLD
jgi:site-specific recombinase XerC